MTKRVLVLLLGLVLVVIAMAGGYVGYAAVKHAQTVALPAPTGRYPVGRTTFDWTDHHRTDPLASQSHIKRSLSDLALVSGRSARPGPAHQLRTGRLGRTAFLGDCRAR